MKDYIIKRVAWIIPTLFFMLTFLFFAFQVIPGDPLGALLGGEGGISLSKQQLEYFRNTYGLNQPLHVRYLNWIWGALQLDFGLSIQTGGKVSQEVLSRLPVTFSLVGMAVLITIILSIPLGILCAFHQDRWPDYILRIFALSALSIPAFWLGIMVILLLLYLWGWFPPLSYATLFTDPWTFLQQLFLPAFILGVRPVGVAVRIVRSSMLEVFREDFLRTARAKGLIERLVVSRHAFPNGLVPIVTYFGLEAVLLVGGGCPYRNHLCHPGIGDSGHGCR